MVSNMRTSALVTGVSRGIGYAITEYLASQEIDLILLPQDPERLRQAKQSIIAAHPKCEVSTALIDMNSVRKIENQLDAIIEHYPPISIFINSEGILRFGASEMPVAQLLELLTINLISTLVISNKLAAKIKLRRAGHIFTPPQSQDWKIRARRPRTLHRRPV